MLSVFCLSGQCRAEPQRKLKHKHPVLTKCCLLDKSTYSVLSLILLYVCSARDAVFDPLAECVVAAEDSVKCAETLAGLQTAQCDRINRTNSGCLFRRLFDLRNLTVDSSTAAEIRIKINSALSSSHESNWVCLFL